ncbi:unnamed protein product [Closterium sp. Yama58-4]|nr:unnamed protein product [Closterium sp. Yama58-4]
MSISQAARAVRRASRPTGSESSYTACIVVGALHSSATRPASGSSVVGSAAGSAHVGSPSPMATYSAAVIAPCPRPRELMSVPTSSISSSSSMSG